MPQLVWDKVGDRVYETGLDRGVLYLPDGSAVPWNGLTSVIEHFTNESSPIYFDGMKIQDMVSLGDFSANMKAITYPDEFLEVEGIQEFRPGMFMGDQRPMTFGLCYRTKIGDDVEGDTAGYKVHLLYNVTAVPSDKAYATQSNEPSLVEFEWSLTAVPEEVPGMMPTAHIVLDSRKFDPWLLEDLEAMIYGTSVADAALLPMQDLITFVNEWFRVKITDNLDGTWTAESMRDGFIEFGNDGFFEIININAVYLNDTTYEISSTIDASDVPQIEIIDNGNGSWNAETDSDALIVFDDADPDKFSILNANVVWLSDDEYRISDTTSET